MIVLHCPHCGSDIPDRDLTQIIRFYDGDQGYTVTCLKCGAEVFWTMTFTTAAPALRGDRKRRPGVVR